MVDIQKKNNLMLKQPYNDLKTGLRSDAFPKISSTSLLLKNQNRNLADMKMPDENAQLL